MFRDLEFYKTAVGWDGCDHCYVHDGFFSEWQSLNQCVTGSLLDAGCGPGSGLRVTGHSLGGGVGGLAMMDLAQRGWKIEEAYTFGMPRTGDEHFAADFNRRFSDVFHRVTHHMDPVVHVPPSDLVTNWHFQHVEPELFFDGKVGQGSIVCAADGDAQCSGQYSDVLHDLFHLGDHMDYMDIQIGTPGCGRVSTDGLERPEGNASLGAGRRHRAAP